MLLPGRPKAVPVTREAARWQALSSAVESGASLSFPCRLVSGRGTGDRGGRRVPDHRQRGQVADL